MKIFSSVYGFFWTGVILVLILSAGSERLTAQNFTISASPFLPSPVTIGGTASSTITVRSTGGFNQSVNLSLGATCPAGASCTLAPQSVTPTAGGVTSTLTIVPTGSTALQSTVTITGTSGALSNQNSVALNVSGGTNSTTLSASDNLKTNFGFGVALGLSANVTGPNIVNNATIDANGIVRVNTRANTTAGFMLETHYFIWPHPPTDAQWQANNQTDTRSWGTGPFVAAQPGSSQIIQAVGAGWMIGFGRHKGLTPSGFGLGVGYESIPAAQVLGSEFVDGQPAPKGPSGTPLPIRYETEDKGSVLVILSVTF